MTKLSADAIYQLLDPAWWVTDNIPSGSPVLPSTMLYYATADGEYGNYASVGNVDYLRSSTDISNYISTYLMWEAARQLANGGCTGSITNIKPRSFQVFPIYFR